MPTGKAHIKKKQESTPDRYSESCRCEIGEDHDYDGQAFGYGLSADEAEDIWLSSGMDEDYDFR